MTTFYLKNILAIEIKTLQIPNEIQLNKFKDYVNDKLDKYSNISINSKSTEYYLNLYNLIFDYWSRDNSLTNLPPKFYRKIPIVLNLQFKNEIVLIKLPGFLESYLNILTFNRDDRSSRKLYKTILRNYKSYKMYEEIILNTIRPLILSSSSVLCGLLKEQHERFKILSPNISSTITELLLLSPSSINNIRSIEDILGDVGIGINLRESEICEDIALKILIQCKIYLLNKNEKILDRTLEYFNNSRHLNKLYHEHLFNEIIDAVLDNYTIVDPVPSIKEKISRFIDKFFGDPRGNQRWYTVPDRQKKVIIRWKVGVTLSVFFKLLDDVARDDKIHAKHWKMRKAFWKELLDNEQITQAWIILGSKCLERKSFFLKDGVGHGIFNSHEGIDATHCAILLEVENYIISEWSHNGATRLFERENPNVPIFYENEYHPRELKKLTRLDTGYITHNSSIRKDGMTIWEHNMRKKLNLEKRIRR